MFTMKNPKNIIEVTCIPNTRNVIEGRKFVMKNTKNRIEVACAPNINIRRVENKKKKEKERNIVLEILEDYCSSSTLHGIGYLGAKDNSLPEKIWWIIMFILSVLACSYLISKTWIKWKNNPVILSFEKEQIPIWQIPFPAVTVCPVNKVLQTEYNYTEMFRNRYNLSEEDFKHFWDISLVCNLEQYGEDFNCSVNITDESAITLIREIAPRLNDTLGSITWQNKDDDNIFAEQLTQEGLCFTFNSFSQQDMFTKELDHDVDYIKHNIKNDGWKMEEGYSSNISMNTHPRRSAKDGRVSGLSFDLYSYTFHTDYVCGMPISGYKIILHNPAETPKAAQQYFLAPLNRKVTIIVRPELTTTSKNVRSLSPHIRKCYFSNEKYLRFFNIYTQNNCRVECDANITRQYCGCVPFYLPRDKKTLICGYGKVECIREVESAILDLEMKEKISNKSKEERERLRYTREIFSKCDCLPSCTSLYYTAETSQTELHMVKTLLASGVMEGHITPKVKESLHEGLLTASQVDIFFKESQFLALHRTELYGQTDFLANCGGLLGLFMGFSLLSLLEIVYFLTIRLWFKYRHRRQNKM